MTMKTTGIVKPRNERLAELIKKEGANMDFSIERAQGRRKKFKRMERALKIRSVDELIALTEEQ